MSIQYTKKMENDTLLVTASGRDDSLEDVKQYGQAVVTAAIQNNCLKILCDETNLVYALGVFEAYVDAEYIAKIAPRIHRVAIICNPNQIGDAKSWETFAVNRGLRIKVFVDPVDAKIWLDEFHAPEEKN